MADEDSKKVSIINEILRLESSTNDALRSSRDEIERLASTATQKKVEVKELERELNALLESRTKKKKRILKLRSKRSRHLTTSSAGDAVEAAMFRRNLSDRRSDSASVVDDNASCTFTVATFDKADDTELASLWNSVQSDGGDASTFRGGGSVNSNSVSHISNMCNQQDALVQTQILLTEKQRRLEQCQKQYNTNAKMLQHVQQQLSVMQREQNIRCNEHDSTINSLSNSKANLISRIRWRENRILNEEKNLVELKSRLAVAKKSTEFIPQCQSKISASNINNDILNELTTLTKNYADLLTTFSSSIFKMIESTITLPPHASISYSIGDFSDTSTIDNKKDHDQQQDKDKSIANEIEDKMGAEEQQQLDELQQSEEQYDAKIQMIENEIKAFQNSYQEEMNANKLVLDEFQEHITSLHDRLVKGGDEIKRLVGEVENLNEKEQKLLRVINASDVSDDEV